MVKGEAIATKQEVWGEMRVGREEVQAVVDLTLNAERCEH